MQNDRTKVRYELTLLGVCVAVSACTIQARVDDGPCPPGTNLEEGECRAPPVERDPPAAWTSDDERPDPVTLPGFNDDCRLEVARERDFGSSTVGRSVDVPLIVRNHGGSVCRVERVVLSTTSNPGFILLGPEWLEVGPDETVPYVIRFAPVRAGPAVGRVEFNTVTHRHTVRLEGRAFEVNGTIVVDPPELEFGPRRIGCRNASWHAVTIRNPTATQVTINTTIVGSGAAAFTLFDSRNRIVRPGATVELLIGFKPSEFGDRWARLSIRAGNSQHFVMLRGVGTDSAALHEKFGGGVESLQLRATPEHGSIRILVDGAMIPSRYGSRTVWSVDFRTRQIVFGPGQTPRETATIEVFYEHPCLGPKCGDGILDDGEACDDGDRDDTDECLSTCRGSFCGDGFLRSGVEECDDQNRVLGDGCNDLCKVERCGNAYLEPPEQCDQGPLNSNIRADACRLDCRFPECQDGVLDDGEHCDDGNERNDDDCVDNCIPATCGDGYVWAGIEECDDGNSDDSDECLSMCRFPSFHTIVSGPVDLHVDGGMSVATSSITLPFDFRFLGRDINTIDVSAPGLVRFGGPGGPSANMSIPTSTAPNGFVAWWWDDELVIDASSSTYVYEFGQTPERELIVSFRDYRLNTARVSADVRIAENDGSIVVIYGNIVGRGGGSATLGWESMDGLRGEDPIGCSPECGLPDWVPGRELRYEQ